MVGWKPIGQTLNQLEQENTGDYQLRSVDQLRRQWGMVEGQAHGQFWEGEVKWWRHFSVIIAHRCEIHGIHSHIINKGGTFLRLRGIWQKTSSWQTTTGSHLQRGRDVSLLERNQHPPDSSNRSFPVQLLLRLVCFSGDLNWDGFPPIPRTWKCFVIGKTSHLAQTMGHVCALDASLDRSFGMCVREKRLGGVELHLYEFSPHLSEQSRASNKSRKCWKQFSSQTYEN